MLCFLYVNNNSTNSNTYMSNTVARRTQRQAFRPSPLLSNKCNIHNNNNNTNDIDDNINSNVLILY